MKKILTALLFILMICSASARGGHRGVFTRVGYDPKTMVRIVIETKVVTVGDKGGYKRVVAYDDGKQWVRLKTPIPIDTKGNLQGELPIAIAPIKFIPPR